MIDVLGEWSVQAYTIRKNYEVGLCDSVLNEFVINFDTDNIGWYNQDPTQNFEWYQQCALNRIMITQPVSESFFTTIVLTNLSSVSTDSSKFLFRDDVEILDGLYIQVSTDWRLTRI